MTVVELDEKGRLLLPASLRRKLGARRFELDVVAGRVELAPIQDLKALKGKYRKRIKGNWAQLEEKAERLARVLADADVFFSYLVADQLSGCSEKVVDRADSGLLKLQVASELYDDIITALRSSNTPIEAVLELLGDLTKIPHEELPTSVEVAAEAMRLYSQYGGSRRLHYFDSFHVATAKLHELPLITSDRFIL